MYEKHLTLSNINIPYTPSITSITPLRDMNPLYKYELIQEVVLRTADIIEEENKLPDDLTNAEYIRYLKCALSDFREELNSIEHELIGRLLNKN